MSDEQTEFFDRLYRDNQAKVYRLALSLAGNAHDAEDITQEAFFRAFRSYGTFREDSSFFTWIYRIAVNVANDHLKYRNCRSIHSPRTKATLSKKLSTRISRTILKPSFLPARSGSNACML